jgi:hypothetical protein
MVNKAFVLQNRRGVTERKRKLVHQHQPGSSSRPRVGPPSAGPVFRPAQPQFQPRLQSAEQIFSTPQRQVIQRPNNLQTLVAGSQNVQRTQATQDLPQADHRCFNCDEKGHYANRCPICTLVLISPLQLHLPQPMEPILFRLPPSRTILMGESTMLLWRKPKKL